jgi:CubicO group peptidase (beta-lactamase class C family)
MVFRQPVHCLIPLLNLHPGSFTYSKAFGAQSLEPPTEQRKPLEKDAVMWMASCTKLMTSICAMQLVERGLVSLDEPVYTHIPELKEFKILKGFNEDGSTIEEPHKTPITLRRLLTHTSGLSYNEMSPALMQWLQTTGKDHTKESDLLPRFTAPLVFEPGTGWMYGSGLDFAGLLIERVTKKSLEAYMKENLWGPLGMEDVTFFLKQRPDMVEKQMGVTRRDAETGKTTYLATAPEYRELNGMEIRDCLGGQGSFANASTYIKVLHAVLTMDEDEKLLKKETAEEMFRPQLNEAGKAGLAALMQLDMVRNAMGVPPADMEKDHGLGGLVFMGDEEGGRRKGTLAWAGLPNISWVSFPCVWDPCLSIIWKLILRAVC